ncbi:MAG: hypothetical protein Q4G69_03730, partial [Planctomycetia bacterium]|nr:hypothetical protein [Planctomycetia bacterium]
NGSSSYPGATGTGNTGYDISKSDVPHDFQSDKGKAESILKNARKLGSQGKYGAAYGEAASVLTLISPYKDKPEGKALIKECQNFMQECAFKVPQSDLTDDEKPNAIQ